MVTIMLDTYLEELRETYGDSIVLWICIGIGLIVGLSVYIAGRWGMLRYARRPAKLRRDGQPRPVVINGPFTQPVRGELVNRSQGRLGLILDQALTPDTTVEVRTTEAPSRIPWVQVRVYDCHQEGKKWAVGCQFIEEVPWSVRVWFG
jgi:hypothetical protein